MPKRKLVQQTGAHLDKNRFGDGIECTKIDYAQKDAAFQDYKYVKIALLGEGRLYGEHDAVADRPYKSSVICSVADSEMLVLSKTDFQRTFKSS